MKNAEMIERRIGHETHEVAAQGIGSDESHWNAPAPLRGYFGYEDGG